MSGFIDFARSHGLQIDPGRLHPSDRVQRCPTVDKPRSKNGSYFFDGSRGWVWNWSGQARVIWWNDPKAAPWSDAEKAAWRERRRALDDERERDAQAAADRAAQMLRTTKPGPHDYLARKGLARIDGLVLPDGRLFVPMRHVQSNALVGAQTIAWNASALAWEKRMLPGMRARGAVLRLGPRSTRITVLVEGFATGLSVEMATRQMALHACVMVCFSADGLAHVAGVLPKRGRAIVFADNDESGAGERAAQATGLPYCMSDVVGNDANDDHQQFGLMAVCQKLVELHRRDA